VTAVSNWFCSCIGRLQLDHNLKRIVAVDKLQTCNSCRVVVKIGKIVSHLIAYVELHQ